MWGFVLFAGRCLSVVTVQVDFHGLKTCARGVPLLSCRVCVVGISAAGVSLAPPLPAASHYSIATLSQGEPYRPCRIHRRLWDGRRGPLSLYFREVLVLQRFHCKTLRYRGIKTLHEGLLVVSCVTYCTVAGPSSGFEVARLFRVAGLQVGVSGKATNEGRHFVRHALVSPTLYSQPEL